MKFITRLTPFALLAPMFAFAQDVGYFTDWIAALQGFITAAIPFVFALAFLVFIWGIFKAFILGGSDPDKQAEGKQLMLYAIIGFVIMIAIWGVVNLVVAIFGFDTAGTIPIPQVPG